MKLFNSSRFYGQGEVTCHHPGNKKETHCSRLRPMVTNDGMESETGVSLFADDVGKVKTNDDQAWNGIRNRMEPLC